MNNGINQWPEHRDICECGGAYISFGKTVCYICENERRQVRKKKEEYEIGLIQRVRGGWDNRVNLFVTLGQAEIALRHSREMGKGSQEQFDNTPIGAWVVVYLYGTLSKIHDMKEAAGIPL